MNKFNYIYSRFKSKVLKVYAKFYKIFKDFPESSSILLFLKSIFINIYFKKLYDRFRDNF